MVTIAQHRDEFSASAEPPTDRSDLRRAIVIIMAVMACAGIVVGLVWPHLVSDVDMIMSGSGPVPVNEQAAGRLMEMDGWFAICSAVTALLTGAVLGAFHLRHGLPTVFALAGGATLAAGLALFVGSVSAVGEVIVAWEPQVPVQTELTAPLMLHAYGVLLIWPIAALAPTLPLAWMGMAETDPVGRDPRGRH